MFYCQHLQAQYEFVFQVKPPRRSRLGDFRVLPTGKALITVNADLPPPAFLITYIHEVAHAAVYQAYQRQRQTLLRVSKPKPHGPAWQRAFQNLMQPLLTEAVFSLEVLNPLCSYLQKPTATTSANAPLSQALRLVEAPMPVTGHLLQDLPEGTLFQFHKKSFRRGALRRTRIVCKEVPSGRPYTILGHAVVKVMTE